MYDELLSKEQILETKLNSCITYKSTKRYRDQNLPYSIVLQQRR